MSDPVKQLTLSSEADSLIPVASDIMEPQSIMDAPI